MTRGRSVLDLIWPKNSSEFTELAALFDENMTRCMLESTWAGYDQLQRILLKDIDLSMADEELERAITQLLEPKISAELTGNEPYYLQHGPYEYETRKPAPAQPPQYDLAFILVSNGRVMWPLEAKVLKSDEAVSRYVNSVEDEFLTGRYAPLVESGAMLGYLFKGEATTAFASISKALRTSLIPHADFEDRPHRVSSHNRIPKYPSVKQSMFQCHHLMMDM